jgi:hypothetical protein
MMLSVAIRRRLAFEYRLCLAVAALLLPAAPAVAAERITVRLHSGRSFTAAVDERSDPDRLWLRFDRPGSMLLRPIAWTEVAGAIRGDQVLDADELLRSLDQLSSKRLLPKPKSTTSDRGAEPVELNGVLQAAAGSSPSTEVTAYRPELPPVVRSLVVDAWVANWDAGVEMDGIVVQVVALDDFGQPLAVDGTLEVNLLGDEYASWIGRDYGHLGRWARPVVVEDFGPEDALYKFEFQAVHPDFETGVSPFALAHVRLTVPGHGTFDATTGMLRLRPYNGVRERLELFEGSRYFHVERTGRGRRHRGAK